MYSKLIAGVMNWGVWGSNLSIDQMKENMIFCVNNGITTFDHADIYGGYTTEETFGNAFKKSGIKRNEIQLISKGGICYFSENKDAFVNYKNSFKLKHYQYGKQHIINTVENSLKNLKTEFLDLFLLHRPSPLMDFNEISETLTLLKKQGKIIDFGVSNFSNTQMDLASSKLPITCNQIEFSLTHFDPIYTGVLDYLILHSKITMAWSPLGSYFKENNAQKNRITSKIEPLALQYNVSIDQLLLAWILKHPSNVYPVIGTTNKIRILKSIEALTIDLDIEDWFSLLVASQGHELA